MSDKLKEPSKSQSEYSLAVSFLKRKLKKRGITYRELAKGIGLSESGIKKILSSNDGSFQRLVQICKYAGVSMNELVEDRSTLNVGFSDRQQKEFLKEPLLFHFYWLLVYERRSLAEAQEDLQLNKGDCFKLARRLDLLGLIKLLPGDRLRLPSIKSVRWVGDGEFLRKLYRDWCLNFVDQLAKPGSKGEDTFMVRYLQMTPKTFAEFLTAQQAIEEEFVRRAVQEMRRSSEPLVHVRWLCAIDNRSFVTGKKLPV